MGVIGTMSEVTLSVVSRASNQPTVDVSECFVLAKTNEMKRDEQIQTNVFLSLSLCSNKPMMHICMSCEFCAECMESVWFTFKTIELARMEGETEMKDNERGW